MRILMLSSSYPPVLGGLQTVAHRLATGLLQRGHTIRVVANRYPRSLPGRDLLDDVPIDRWTFMTPTARYLPRRLDLFLLAHYVFRATLIRLDRLISDLRPDIVNVHYPDAQIPFLLHLRHRFNARLVLSLHGYEVEQWFAGTDRGTPLSGGEPPRRRQLRQFQAILAAADMVTACSGDLLRKAIAIAPSVADKGQVIHNGVDLRRFDDKAPYTHARPYILALGRLNRQKGFDLLLDAFGAVAPEHPNIDLILGGEGEELLPLQAQAQQLGLGERVHFYGRAQPDQVVHLLNGCLFTVVSSRSEPFGIVALEALAAGKPVLATRVGGLPEFLDERGSGITVAPDGNGLGRTPTLLVEPTVAGLAQGLSNWLAPACRTLLGSSTAPADISAYGWERVIDRYERALRGV